ncbi:MAG: 30S ribosomal protein S20 [Salaquimonas sp.]
MANTASAKKSVRKLEARTEVNKSNRTRMRTFVRKAEESITAGKADEASAAMRTAESEIMRAVSKGILKKNTASRKISRLVKRVKALSA